MANRHVSRAQNRRLSTGGKRAADLHDTKMMAFRGSVSSKINYKRGGILMAMGNFPENLSQQVLAVAGIILVGRVGVKGCTRRPCTHRPCTHIGRGDNTVGSPHRAQIVQFEFLGAYPRIELDDKFPVEQFEATASQFSLQYPPPFLHVHTRSPSPLEVEPHSMTQAMRGEDVLVSL